MKIKEYLQKKYNVKVGTTLLKTEAKIFGCWPMTSGWWNRLGDAEITPEMRERLVEALMRCTKTSRTAGLQVLGVPLEDIPPKPVQIPNPPGTNKKRASAKARKKAKKEARRIAALVPNPKPYVMMKPPAKTYSAPVVHITRPTRPLVVEEVDVRSTAFLSTYAWTTLRMVAIKKYGRVCQCCGASTELHGVRMNVDHIKPRKLFPELALDLDNLQILCDDCNKGKGNWDMTDWRPEEPAEPELTEEQRAHLRSI